MDKLLKHYKEELAFLQDEAREFARLYPRIASGLMLSAQGSEDPNVNRLIQSVAMLNARAHRRVGDDYGGFADNLLDALSPQPMRPRPSAAIARFSPSFQAGSAASATLWSAVGTNRLQFIIRGTPRVTDPDVGHVAFRGVDTVSMDDGSSWHGASLAVTFAGPVHASVRLFIDADPTLAAPVRDLLAFGSHRVAVRRADGTHVVGGAVVQAYPEDALDPCAPCERGNPAMDILGDFFAMPARYSFFDIHLPDMAPDTAVCELRILLDPKSPLAQGYPQLRRLDANNLATRCAAVLNIHHTSRSLSASAEQRASHLLLPDAGGGALVAIASVFASKGSGKASDNGQLLPHYYSAPRDPADHYPGYWVAHPAASAAGATTRPGSITLTVVREQGGNESLSLSAKLWQCDGDRAQQVVCGTASSVLRKENQITPSATLITVPTVFDPSPAKDVAMWHLVSQLRASQSSLLNSDGKTLREILLMHAGKDHALRHAITGFVGVAQRPILHWLPGAYPPSLVRGVEVRLTVDEDCFIGQGLHAWALMLDRFFATYIHINSFTQLILCSLQTGKDIHTCQPRSGSTALI